MLAALARIRRGGRARAVGVAALAAAVAGGCSRSSAIDRERAAELFDRVTLDTGGAHGLSGLTADADGALWTVAERDQVAFRIVLSSGLYRTPGSRPDVPTVTSMSRHPVVGLPDGEDLEAVAAVDGGLVVGTEGHQRGEVHIYRLDRRLRDGDRFEVGVIHTFTGEQLGVEVGANHGAEGVCAAGGRVAVAIETAGTDARGRWAPLAIVDERAAADGAAIEPVRVVVRLGTATGKLSAVACWTQPGDRPGRIRALAIERHFEVTRLVAFDLPDEGDVAGEVTPTVALDLGPVLRGSLNLEGLARLPDGRIVAVVDNQYGRITGPDELLVFRPGVVVLPP